MFHCILLCRLFVVIVIFGLFETLLWRIAAQTVKMIKQIWVVYSIALLSVYIVWNLRVGSLFLKFLEFWTQKFTKSPLCAVSAGTTFSTASPGLSALSLVRSCHCAVVSADQDFSGELHYRETGSTVYHYVASIYTVHTRCAIVPCELTLCFNTSPTLFAHLHKTNRIDRTQRAGGR